MIDVRERLKDCYESCDVYALLMEVADEYDALTARCERAESALLTERGKLEKADAENERLAARIDDLEAAGVHTHNGDQCRHLACVNDRLQARLAELVAAIEKAAAF